MLTQQKITLDEFIAFALHPDQSEQEFELINGEVVEKRPGTASNSAIAVTLGYFIGAWCRPQGLPCTVTGAAGPYRVLDHVLVPDCAYKQTRASSDYPDPLPPLWAAEVVSDNDRPRYLRSKRKIYLQAGILYWEIYPEDRSVDVYTPPGDELHTYRENDTIDLSDLIPGFTLAVRELFG